MPQEARIKAIRKYDGISDRSEEGLIMFRQESSWAALRCKQDVSKDALQVTRGGHCRA
jgi:hypothetical protein